MLVDRLSEEKDGLKCELTVSTSRQPFAGLLREGRFNLSSPTTRGQWVKALDERMVGPDWYAAFETICTLTRRRWREGEPVLDLACVQPRSGLPFLLPPYIVLGASSVLFAEGGAGKSLWALAAMTSIATGEPILGSAPTMCGPGLYLDWEWDAETHAERLQAICAGAGIEAPLGMIHYRHEFASVIESAPTIRRRIAEIGAVFVVIDSLGFARGGEPESAELTIKTFSVLRSFNVPVLVLDHVAKNATDKKHSFGSIYTTNAARITWRLEAAKEEGQSRFVIGLTNQKANGRFQGARGYEVTLETDDDDRLLVATFQPTDLKAIPAFTKSLTLSDSLIAILKANGRPLETDDIHSILFAEGQNVNIAVIRATLNRNKRLFTRSVRGWSLLAPVTGVTEGA